jgi:predicted TIM-barrel enzyme
MATADVIRSTEELRKRLLCGIEPTTLDPAIAAGIELVARLIGTANAKTGKEIASMSLAELSKALMNAAKAVDGLARLRSFAAGGPDSAPQAPQFILQVTPPAEAKTE